MHAKQSGDELAYDVLTHMESMEDDKSKFVDSAFPGALHRKRAEALRREALALKSKSGLVRAVRLGIIYLDESVAVGSVGAAADLKKLRRALKQAGEAP